MAITARAAGAWAYAASGSVTPTLPTHAAGDMLMVRVAYKSSAIATCAASTTTQGWNKLGEFHDGTTVSGNGVGSVAVAHFWKIAFSAAETAPTIAFSQTVTQVGHSAVSFQKGSTEVWYDPVGDGGGFATGAPISATIQSHVSVTSGDVVVFFLGSRDDTAFTSPTITQTGVTFDAVTEYPATAGLDGSGADGSYDAGYRTATAGTSSAAAVITATIATETGSAWMTRLRVANPAGTTIYPTADATAVTASTQNYEVWTSRGTAGAGGLVSGIGTTVAGPTAPIQHQRGAGAVDWYTRPLTAFTLGGGVRVNLWPNQSNVAANSTINCEIARVAGDGTSATVWGTSTNGEENPPSASPVVRSFLVTGADLAISDGQRLRIRFYGDDAAGVTMGAGFSSQLAFARSIADVQGDTFLVFTQTLTEAAAGNQTATPTTAALVITKHIPTVTASDHQLVTPTTKALTATAFAPAVSTPELATPTTVSLATATFAPTVTDNAYSAAVMADGPVAWYRMGEPSGSVIDSIPGGTAGSTVGTVTRDVTGGIAVGDDGAIDIGASGGVSVADQTKLDLGNGPFSIECWVYLDGLNTAGFVSKSAGGAYQLAIDGSVDKLIVVKTGLEVSYTGSTVLTTGTWYHVVWVKVDPGTAETHLYLNGVEETLSGSGSSYVNTTGPLLLGHTEFGENLDGKLDEVAIYNTALSGARALAHYTAATAVNVTVTPTTTALTLAPFAPTITATEHQAVTPTTRTLTLATFAPTVTTPELVTPITKALGLAAFAPTVTTTDVQLVTPATAALALATFAPAVSTSDNQAVTPTTASLTATKYAPTISTPELLTPANAALTLTRFLPTVTVADNQRVVPTTAAVTLQPFAPSITASNHQSVTPTTKALSLAAFAPTVSTPERVTPTTKALALATFAPTISAPDPQLVTPTTKAVTVSTFAPSVGVSDAASIVPPNAALTITTYAPIVTQPDPQLVTPVTATLAAATYAPTVTSGNAQTVTPATAALVATRHPPTVAATAHEVASPTTRALTLTTSAPTVTVNQIVTPATVSLALTRFVPAVSATTGTYVYPDPTTLTITEYAPVIEISGHADITPLATALHLTTYPPTAEQHSITPLPDLIYGFAIVATGDSSRVGTVEGGATVRVSEGGSTAVSTSGSSARVTIR